jgi:hypothetical protein
MVSAFNSAFDAGVFTGRLNEKMTAQTYLDLVTPYLPEQSNHQAKITLADAQYALKENRVRRNSTPLTMKEERYAKFEHEAEAAGYPVKEYHGRYFYVGPAVFIEAEDLQALIRATTMPLQWDSMGKSGLVVYPK